MTIARHRLALLPSIAAAMLVTAAPAFAAKADAQNYQSLLQSSSNGSKVACGKDSYGNVACTIDGQAVEVGDDCTSNLAFGGIANDKGTMLQDNFRSAGARPVAHVGKNQLVCLLASQRKEGELIRALVKVVPTATVKNCKGNDACKDADTHVEWKRPVSGTACTLKPDGHYAGDCATGWIDGKDLEEYSMGLKPEDTGA